MNRFIKVALCLLVFGWAVDAHAEPRGKAFFKGFQTLEELAQALDATLDRDPTGQSMISGSRCRADGSCGAPVDYLKMFREIDPKGEHLGSVNEVSTYVRLLEMREAPDGKYWMACLRHSRTSSTGYEPLLHCLSRSFKPGEKVAVNPKTDVKVFAQRCSNPIEKPEIPVTPVTKNNPCVEIDFFTKETETAVRLTVQGPTDLSEDGCTGLKRAGEEDYESPYVEECPDVFCTFRNVGGGRRGSFAPTPGKHVLRLPAKVVQENSGYMVVFCVDRDAQHSCGVGVEWLDYVPTGNTKVATIYYDDEALAQANAKTVTGQWSDLRWIFGRDCR